MESFYESPPWTSAYLHNSLMVASLKRVNKIGKSAAKNWERLDESLMSEMMLLGFSKKETKELLTEARKIQPEGSPKNVWSEVKKSLKELPDQQSAEDGKVGNTSFKNAAEFGRYLEKLGKESGDDLEKFRDGMQDLYNQLKKAKRTKLNKRFLHGLAVGIHGLRLYANPGLRSYIGLPPFEDIVLPPPPPIRVIVIVRLVLVDVLMTVRWGPFIGFRWSVYIWQWVTIRIRIGNLVWPW